MGFHTETVRPAFRDDNRSPAASCQGRCMAVLPETHQQGILAVPDMVSDILPVSLDKRTVRCRQGFTPEQMELFIYYCSPNVVMMTVPVFMTCRHINVRSGLIRKMLANLTACGFGVYMIHYFFTGPGVALMRAISVPICIQIPAAAVIAFAVSWLLVIGIRKLTGRTARYWVG